ncbi:hypothetical protein OBBRIDRAFT_742081 [Obba rivulosa]|uniref:Reverse transcriptase zinc-binding domain-containing protein n=1 Tax=Obba rivulosa TaxID=1052685 RepID=A0A8E2AS04_9APHY|nr:hypothetical protein OBBRIDRAFT_742081 [Obba rivulosa]
MGLFPLRFRRALLALRYLVYLLSLDCPLLAHCALTEVLALARDGAPSWAGDLVFVLTGLGIPVDLPRLSDAGYVHECQDRVATALDGQLHEEILNSSRLRILSARPLQVSVVAFHPYLRIAHTRHRKALARLIASEHPLRVELMRRDGVVREARLCRFCDGAVEDEEHILFTCEGDARLVARRELFWQDAVRTWPALQDIRRRRSVSLLGLLHQLLAHNGATTALAHYVYDIFQCCTAPS